MSDQNYEQRIGRRHDVVPIPVGWNVNPKPSRLGRHRPPTRAEVLDVSHSGAAVRAPVSKDLEVGKLIFIEVDGTLGQVFIRRIKPIGNQPTMAHYGIEFAHPNGRMALRLTSKVIVAPVVGAVDGWSDRLAGL